MSSILVKDVYKSFGKTEALRGVSMEVGGGELFGMIGPDGSGKTSLFRIMTSLMLPDKGIVLVDGFDTVEQYEDIRKEVGYMPGRFSLYMDLSVEENLKFYASIFGTTIQENYHLIKDIYSHIEPYKKRRADKLSGGMKQKLALSCALIHEPKILFLDEPTTGVDPVSRKEFWTILKNLQKSGMTIVVSTPYMDEANLCDRIALIDNGKFLMIDTPANIIAGFARKLWHAASDDKYRVLLDLREYDRMDDCYVFGEYHHFTIKEEMQDSFNPENLRSFLAERGHRNIVIEPVEPTIEDTFMKLSKSNGEE